MIDCVDLFCGIGGLSHGLLRGGVRVRAGVDVDHQCRFPYEANNPATFICADVATLSAETLRALWGKSRHTLLAGCAPCQPFSTYSRKVHKRRAGVQATPDSRWSLVSRFAELIKVSKPTFVTMENVPQLVDHPVFDDFMAALSGYCVSSAVIECSHYGVPQTRKRLVLLASLLGPVALSAPESIRNPPTVRSAIAHVPPLSAGQTDPNDTLHSACRLSPLNLRRIKASTPGGTWRDWPRHLVAECHRRSSGNTYPSVYGRMEWDKPAPTITTQSFGYGNGRFGHPQQHRAITLREAAILQTFPPTYQFLRPDEKVCYHTLGRLIGNAVPVRIGEIVATTLLEHVRQYGWGKGRRAI